MKYCLKCNAPLYKKDDHYGQHLNCFKEIFCITEKLDFHSLAQRNSSSSRKDEKKKPHLTSYFAGNYRKYEGKLGESSYILKMSIPKAGCPELAAVEYVCNKIACYCGIPVPDPFTLIEIEKSERAFVSKNFMHSMKSHASLVHIYHYLPDGEKNYNVETLSKTIYEQTNSAIDVKTYFKTLLYDALVGNHDRHGSNLALVETAKNKRLSPIYDNPSSLGLESTLLGAHFSPRGKIGTHDSQEPTMKDYLDEMRRLGVEDISKDFFTNLKFSKIISTIDEAVCLSPRMKVALKKLINERYKILKDYVTSE